MVSNSIVISWYTILISIVTFPIMLAVLMKIKSKARISPFLLGLLVYFTFGVFATSVVNTIFLNSNRPTYNLLNDNVVAYTLYFAVVVGFLEVLGIFVAFKKILVNHDDKQTALMFALGHAGMEAFMACFLALATYISWANVLNDKGPEGFAEFFSDIENFDPQEAIDTITAISVSDVVLLALQRIAYFGMNIFLSIMIFYAAKKDIKPFFWMAVLFRGLCTVPGSVERFISSNGTTGKFLVLLFYLMIVLAALGYCSMKLYKKYDDRQVLYPLDLFKKHPDPHF